MYQINSIEELIQYFASNNIINSNDLANKGLDYWENKLKAIINPLLFKKPQTKEELIQLIEDNYSLLLIDTSNISDLKNLFKNEYNDNLKTKEYWKNPMNYLGFWNTENVKDISSCFFNQINFNQRIFWNTEKVENAQELFFNCRSLNQEIEFNLSKCKNISDMFCNCEKLNSKISLKNLNNVEYAKSLFCCCENLNQEIELNLDNCKNISDMFYYCKKLNSKIILNNPNNIVEFYSLFSHCSKLEFNNIESTINYLIIKFKNIGELEKTIGYKIPEEYKNKIKNKQFIVVNQI